MAPQPNGLGGECLFGETHGNGHAQQAAQKHVLDCTGLALYEQQLSNRLNGGERKYRQLGAFRCTFAVPLLKDVSILLVSESPWASLPQACQTHEAAMLGFRAASRLLCVRHANSYDHATSSIRTRVSASSTQTSRSRKPTRKQSWKSAKIAARSRNRLYSRKLTMMIRIAMKL